jgi:hypothetical protein
MRLNVTCARDKNDLIRDHKILVLSGVY